MREIVFDTETTGLSFSGGDRLVEIGCVELFNRVETGRTFHCYFNPQRAMAAEAEAVHGLGDAFLSDKPLFGHKVQDLLDFIADSPLVAHNAGFDFGFLNGELGLCSRPAIAMDRMIDTLVMARSKIPGAKHTLDALCVRFGVDRSRRVLHGALLDAQLLAQVYVELTGGRQIGLGLAVESVVEPAAAPLVAPCADRPHREFSATDAELDRHRAFIAKIGDALWAGAD
ncbi:DNA polymerase III subunit epsilon [Stakelama sp. CBK3Z-3]|uniref:DNA polymerase III subunit epsilon n=1 Tax=Stakelama flava TaxID=2860338 RepID=A0ABS6XKJ7_9SPHN|nr:DNA polymerase III subunit epsilon [Stakelama flava]MBW4330729.1 DNA polymerase III subunit epsilon [Stakelama flava]